MKNFKLSYEVLSNIHIFTTDFGTQVGKKIQ